MKNTVQFGVRRLDVAEVELPMLRNEELNPEQADSPDVSKEIDPDLADAEEYFNSVVADVIRHIDKTTLERTFTSERVQKQFFIKKDRVKIIGYDDLRGGISGLYSATLIYDFSDPVQLIQAKELKELLDFEIQEYEALNENPGESEVLEKGPLSEESIASVLQEHSDMVEDNVSRELQGNFLWDAFSEIIKECEEGKPVLEIKDRISLLKEKAFALAEKENKGQ